MGNEGVKAARAEMAAASARSHPTHLQLQFGGESSVVKILELRRRAQRELGAKFDVCDFHDVVLRNGTLPMELLEEVVGAISPGSAADVGTLRPMVHDGESRGRHGPENRNHSAALKNCRWIGSVSS